MELTSIEIDAHQGWGGARFSGAGQKREEWAPLNFFSQREREDTHPAPKWDISLRERKFKIRSQNREKNVIGTFERRRGRVDSHPAQKREKESVFRTTLSFSERLVYHQVETPLINQVQSLCVRTLWAKAFPQVK